MIVLKKNILLCIHKIYDGTGIGEHSYGYDEVRYTCRECNHVLKKGEKVLKGTKFDFWSFSMLLKDGIWGKIPYTDFKMVPRDKIK